MHSVNTHLDFFSKCVGFEQMCEKGLFCIKFKNTFFPAYISTTPESEILLTKYYETAFSKQPNCLSFYQYQPRRRQL